MTQLLDWIFRIIAWAVQIGAVLLIAFLLAAVVQAAEEFFRKNKVKFRPRLLAVFLLLCIVLAIFAVNPPVICPKRYQENLTPELRERVQSGGDGLYSWNIPLVPVCIEITDWKNYVIEGKMEYVIEFSVYYFCFGRLEMRYATHDGYSASPMFGLQ